MDELTTLYRRLAIDAHPDKGPESERPIRTIVMQQINMAYQNRDIDTLRRLSQTMPGNSSPQNNQYSRSRLTMPRLPEAPPLGSSIDSFWEVGTQAGIHSRLHIPLVTTSFSGSVSHLVGLSDLELANTPEFLEYAQCLVGAVTYLDRTTSIEECLQQYRRLLGNWESNYMRKGGAYSPSHY